VDHRHHHHEDDDLIQREELAELRKIEADEREIAGLLREDVLSKSATAFSLRQINFEGGHMAIDPTKNGVVQGTTGYFQASTLPIGSLLKPGTVPTFSTGDTSVTLAPTPDGDPNKIAASVALTEALPSFGLTISGTALDGTAISTTFNIPVLPAGSTGGVPATGFDLTQVTAAAAGVGGGTGPGTGGTGTLSVTPSTASLSLASGATQQLTPTDSNTAAAFTYVSDTPTVATVSSTGLITPVSVGTANITITDGAGNTSVVPVTVTA